jgi:hypothetical protein
LVFSAGTSLPRRNGSHVKRSCKLCTPPMEATTIARRIWVEKSVRVRVGGTELRNVE